MRQQWHLKKTTIGGSSVNQHAHVEAAWPLSQGASTIIASAEDMFQDICSFLDQWLPRYRDNNRSYITVALGCTGGQHRSVYLAERLYRRYREDYPEVNIRHRELQS